MSRFGIIFTLFTLALILSVGLRFWSDSHTQNSSLVVEENRDLEDAEHLLALAKPREALMIIHNHKQEIERKSKIGQKWMDLFIQASEQQDDIAQLILLYEFSPQSFDNHEEAVLIVGDAYLDLGKGNEYEALRNRWKDRGTQSEEWLLLDSDKLMLDGEHKKALILLSTKIFHGKTEIGQLIRLALLYGKKDSQRAWNYLEEAYTKDPQNPEVYLYRAQLQESLGNNTRALAEYRKAIQLDPDDIILQDQLAEFFIQNRQYDKALEIWKANLQPPSLDIIWLKVLFWNKVAQPIDFDWHSVSPPRGTLTPLIEYLLDLKPGQFWDEQKFKQVKNGNYYLSTHQETYWLRLFEELKSNDIREASLLLQYNPFNHKSWNPDLELVLKQIIDYRQPGSFGQLGSIKSNHIFYQQLNSPSKPVKELLTSKEVYSAACLAAGWNEAALNLHTMPVIPDYFPEWVAYDLTQAYMKNRDHLEALDFASMQKPSPALLLLKGELLIKGGNINAGLEKLNKLAKMPSELGVRATFVMSQLHFNRGEYDKAKQAILNNQRLANEVSGVEMLARITHLEGNLMEADGLYLTIEKESSEAKSYLARRAYEEKNWNRARELTEELLKEHPNNSLLRENLRIIIKKQGMVKHNSSY